jgi:hypothetical protein
MSKLLEILNRLSLRLFIWRYVFLALALAGLASGLFAAMTDRDLESRQLRVSLVCAMWALLLFVYSQLFRRIPPPVLPKLRLMDRLRDQLRLLSHQALALFIVLVTVLVLQVSLKLLTV